MDQKKDETNASAALETKLVQLRLTTERTDGILVKADEESIARHQGTLRTVINEVDKLRFTVEAERISRHEETTEWNAEIDKKISDADGLVRLTKEWLADNNKKREEIEKEEKIKFEVKLHETKVKLQSEHSLQSAPQASKTMIGMQAKLPKLVITRFNGSPMDWPRFWGQFSENIDKSSIAPVTKFSYLRELLEPKVRQTVEALPFNAEGYNRAICILKDKFGKESEIVKGYTREILGLPTIQTANPRKIHEFSEKLSYCVQALETLNKLEGVNGAVPMTLDKLPSIRGDLVRTDHEWERWTFLKLVKALNEWCRRNPIDKPEHNEDPFGSKKRDKLFHVFNQRSNLRTCIYCDSGEHKANSCAKVTLTSARKQILAKKKLCFNCAAGNHKASECPSKASCRKCEKRHHTSICDSHDDKQGGETSGEKSNVAMTTSQKSEAVFPVVVVEVNGIRCRALIDSGAGSSYVSAKLIDLLKLKPSQSLIKNIDMLMASKTSKLDVYDLKLASLDGSFSLPMRATKVNKGELLSIENPKYPELISQHAHLEGVTIHDDGIKDTLPVHVILGSGEYAKIKTNTRPRIGNGKAPIAELTKFAWFVMGPGYEFESKVVLMTQTHHTEYEELCRLDVLGLEDTPQQDQSLVFDEFKEQLTRSQQGQYETALPWKPNHPYLPNNERGSLKRLASLTKKPQRENLMEKYDEIIQDQLAEGVIERVPPPAVIEGDTGQPLVVTGSKATPPPTITGSDAVPFPTTTEMSSRSFYIPHRYVILESAQTTKMRIVYDASAKAPSLNDCLYAGPALQNKLWDVLVQQTAFPVIISGDIRQAFLQIRVRQSERDALRFHWRSPNDTEIQTYRFTRVLFGLAPSPFLLGGVLEYHLASWSQRYPEVVERLRRSLYVDDILTGGQDTTQAQQRKATAIEIMDDAKFKLHKWNSNVPELEDDNNVISEEQSFAKQQLQVKPSESKLLGLKWDKAADTITVEFPVSTPATTKRELLASLVKIYDPLGLASPITLQGKLVFRDVCDSKIGWDSNLPDYLQKRWCKFEKSLPERISVPRPLAPYHQPVHSAELHVFGDASTEGVGTVVYSVVRQTGGVKTSLVAARSRLAKKNLTVPRLELVSAHMSANLVMNVKNALVELPTQEIIGWSDSTVVLHWVRGNGLYKQFVANRVKKIREHSEIQWRYVPTEKNPADIASRGGPIVDGTWLSGPEWLADRNRWPENRVTEKSPASEAEAKVMKEVLSLARERELMVVSENDRLENLLQRHDLLRTLRIQAWVHRFTITRHRRGPLTSDDLRDVRDWWIRREQAKDYQRPHFENTKQSLNLIENQHGILECHGRIQGDYPIYLPAQSDFTQKLVQRYHVETLHGGVLLTMAVIREIYWIPT